MLVPHVDEAMHSVVNTLKGAKVNPVRQWLPCHRLVVVCRNDRHILIPCSRVAVTAPNRPHDGLWWIGYIVEVIEWTGASRRGIRFTGMRVIEPSGLPLGADRLRCWAAVAHERWALDAATEALDAATEVLEQSQIPGVPAPEVGVRDLPRVLRPVPVVEGQPRVDHPKQILEPVDEQAVPGQELRPMVYMRHRVDLVLLEPPGHTARNSGNSMRDAVGVDLVMRDAVHGDDVVSFTVPFQRVHLHERAAEQVPLHRINESDVAADSISKSHDCPFSGGSSSSAEGR